LPPNLGGRGAGLTATKERDMKISDIVIIVDGSGLDGERGVIENIHGDGAVEIRLLSNPEVPLFCSPENLALEMKEMGTDKYVDEEMDRLPLGYYPTSWVVVMVAPRCWDAVEDYDGIEQQYGNMSGCFSDKREAEEHAAQLNH
jgi:hypothetical protein